MATAAVVAGYLWLSLILFVVLGVVVALAADVWREVRGWWRGHRRDTEGATVTDLYPRSDVVPLHRGRDAS